MAKNLEFTYDVYIGAPVAKVWKGHRRRPDDETLRLRHPSREQTEEGSSVCVRWRWRLQGGRWRDPRDRAGEAARHELEGALGRFGREGSPVARHLRAFRQRTVDHQA